MLRRFKTEGTLTNLSTKNHVINAQKLIEEIKELSSPENLSDK